MRKQQIWISRREHYGGRDVQKISKRRDVFDEIIEAGGDYAGIKP